VGPTCQWHKEREGRPGWAGREEGRGTDVALTGPTRAARGRKEKRKKRADCWARLKKVFLFSFSFAKRFK